MVRMLDIRSICLSRPYDNGFRLTHAAVYEAKRKVNGRERVPGAGDDQPAFAASQEYGSTIPPLIHTSKWRWFAVDRPVLPT